MGFMTDIQRRMVSENHDLIYEFLRKHCLDEEEYYGSAAIGLCDAGISYTNGSGDFREYAETCMMDAVKNEFVEKCKGSHRCGSRAMERVEWDSAFLEGCLVDSMEELLTMKLMLTELLERMNEKEREIAKMVFSGFRQKEITEYLRVSADAVTLVRRRLKDCLR